MASTRLDSTIENVNLWCLENNVELLDNVMDSRTHVRFKILSGEYKGLIGSKSPSTMVPNSHKFNWRTLTEDSKKKYTIDVFKAEGFTVLEFPNVLGTKDKIKVSRDIDGLEWETSLINFREGYRPRDIYKSSLGEQSLELILMFNNITYIKEHTVNIDGRDFRYDFYLPEHNVYVEYHGIQHFKEVSLFTRTISFEERTSIDERKKLYAESVGGYVMIPYTDTSMDVITNSLKEAMNTQLVVPTHKYVQEYKNSLINRDQEIATYYLEHTDEETRRRYNVSRQTIQRAFIRVYGCDRTTYIRDRKALGTDTEIANYFLTHSMVDTVSKYNTNHHHVARVFLRTYGENKTEHRKRLNNGY